MSIIRGSLIEILDEGVSQGFANAIDFTGAGVSATLSGNLAAVSIPGGGAGASATTVIVTAPYASTRLQVTVVDATVLATSKIMLSLGSMLDTATTADDDIDLNSMQAIPAAGSFTFRAAFRTPFGGPLTINYMVLT